LSTAPRAQSNHHCVEFLGRRPPLCKDQRPVLNHKDIRPIPAESGCQLRCAKRIGRGCGKDIDESGLSKDLAMLAAESEVPSMMRNDQFCQSPHSVERSVRREIYITLHIRIA
jgi:hypothetical protein